MHGVADSGKSWAKNAYVNFDIVHSAAKAHLDSGCTYLIQSATLNVHIAKDSKALSGMHNMQRYACIKTQSSLSDAY